MNNTKNKCQHCGSRETINAKYPLSETEKLDKKSVYFGKEGTRCNLCQKWLFPHLIAQST